MRYLTVGVFGHLEITSPIYVDKRTKYMQLVLRGKALKKYKQILVGCNLLMQGLAVDQWELGATKDLTITQLCTWESTDSLDGLGYIYLGLDRCIDF